MKTLLFCIISCILFLGCKKKEYKAVAPPIYLGNCSVYTYLSDGRVFDQTCTYEGYYWYCKDGVCWRKEPLPAETK